MMELAGPTKAAIFLLSLEEDKTLRIIEQLNEQEVRSLRSAVDELEPVTQDVLDQVYTEFTEAFKEGRPALPDGNRYLQDLVRRAHSEEDAVRWFASDQLDPNAPAQLSGRAGEGNLSRIAESDPTTLGFSIAEEHPQVAAAVLAHLEPQAAAKVLEELEPSRQTDIIFRITALRPFPVTAFADAAYGLGGGVDLKASSEAKDVDGVSMAATILNEMASTEATELLDRLSEDHPDDVVKLQRAMFTMEDLVDADKRGLQQLLKEVQTDILLVALKTASDPLREKLYGCMSKRAAAMLEEEAEMLPPMRLSEVEAAQDQIVETAMRLIGEGKINVAGRGDDMV